MRAEWGAMSQSVLGAGRATATQLRQHRADAGGPKLCVPAGHA